MKISSSVIGLWVAASLGVAATTTPALKLTPATISVRAAAKPATQTFTATESGTTHTPTYAWALSGAAGATGSLGTIDSKGVYTPPVVPPVPNTVTVTVTDSANTLSATATITVLDPVPVISSLSPYNVNTGLAYTVDIIGSNFMPSDQVMLGATPVATAKFISSTDIRITGASTAAAGTKLSITVVDPNTTAGGKTSNAASLNVVAPVAVTVSPDGRTIRCGAALALSWHVANNSNQSVTWQVNGVPGGNASVGTVTSTISATGATTVTYNAPADLPPNPSTATPLPSVPVKITATSAADPNASATLTVNLQNPVPVISSVTPNSVSPGLVNLTITGTGFAPNAVVYLAGTSISSNWVSDTRLTAIGTVNIPFGGTAALKVTNPAPGAATSVPLPISVQLPVAVVRMPYADAVRFLQMTSWGPTPSSVAALQTIGRDQWLLNQFNTAPSTWPDPLSDNEGMNRLQAAFFNIATGGQDQLRQRVSFALAQIMVASGVKDTQFSQMVGYQRVLGNDAFGDFRTLLGDITLNPAMGYFLDMVNNDKANARKGTVANENYAREVMQLFTVGLTQLNQDGTPDTQHTAPEYTQDTVTEMAKVFTGWTYSPAPGYAGQWPNQPYYFAPMVSFDSHHDMTAKLISLPKPCTIPANGTAVADLNMTLDCLAGQSNIAPFISYRLIQRLVESNPSPAYVARVAAVFNTPQTLLGQKLTQLQGVVYAILTDPEASLPGTGKLTEPVLYATNLLRALNATVNDTGGINNWSTAMGQNVMEPSSVFSYFSPFYRLTVPSTDPTQPKPAVVPAPEFQGVNAATSIARANFAWRAVTNGIEGTVKIDLSNLQDLAAIGPNALVDAINQGLFRGQMTSSERSYILAAATQTSPSASVRSALYAAAAAPQFEVQQ
ncbi:MAG TPA: DUF1800 family protein [Bryobacteraceae bacterium]